MISKDWMQNAANEIASHWTYGSGRDNYVTDEQRWNVANNFRVIIEKHIPYQVDVAYMPVPRCDQCKHWERRNELQVGKCSKLMIWLPEDFGCIAWEAK